MTPAELLKKTDAELKQLAGKWLTSGPWGHDWSGNDKPTCRRCHADRPGKWACAFPPPAQGSMADIAERLIAHILTMPHGRSLLVHAALKIVAPNKRQARSPEEEIEDCCDAWCYLATQPGIDKVIVCLMALEERTG